MSFFLFKPAGLMEEVVQVKQLHSGQNRRKKKQSEGVRF